MNTFNYKFTFYMALTALLVCLLISTSVVAAPTLQPLGLGADVQKLDARTGCFGFFSGCANWLFPGVGNDDE